MWGIIIFRLYVINIRIIYYLQYLLLAYTGVIPLPAPALHFRCFDYIDMSRCEEEKVHT